MAASTVTPLAKYKLVFLGDQVGGWGWVLHVWCWPDADRPCYTITCVRVRLPEGSAESVAA